MMKLSPVPFEDLASSDQIDLSVLLDLVMMAPDISDAAYTNVRELISLRILESIFTHDTSVSSNSIQKIGFDPSDRCEDVLRRIVPDLCSMSAWNLKAAAAMEMSKWDVKPFIEHKKSSLPKCTLELVKYASITGSYPSLVSLRERSGMKISNRPENDAPIDSGDSNGITIKPDKGELCAKISAENDVVVSPVVETTKHALHDTLLSKRKRNIAAEITEGYSCKDLIVWKDSIETIREAVKKHKCNALHSENQAAYQAMELANHKPKREVSKCNTIETIMKAVKRNKADALPCENQAAHCDMELPNEKQNGQGHDRNIEVLNKKGLFKCTKANEDLNSVPDADEAEKGNSRADNDQYHDKMADKDDYLADDSSELKLCVKCDNGVNVLFCCTESCPVVIHENCLGLDVSFDKDGNFYCPFCAYSKAFSAHQEAKQKVIATKKDLTAFIGGKIRKETKKQRTRFYKMSRDHSKGVKDLPKFDDRNNKDSTGAIFSDKLDEHRNSQDRRAINEVSERRDQCVETSSKKGVSGSIETELRRQHKISPSAESCDAEISQEDDECACTSRKSSGGDVVSL